MLIEGRLVKTQPHLAFGTKESGQTWVLLADAATLLKQDRTVVWVDQEMGRRDITERLLALGVTAEQMRPERFVYSEFASLDMSPESLTMWRDLLRYREPELVVVDAQQKCSQPRT